MINKYKKDDRVSFTFDKYILNGKVLDTVAEAWKRTGQILNKVFNGQILDNENKRSTNNKF